MNVSLTSHSIHTVCMRFGFSSSTARSSNKAIMAARRSKCKTNHSEIFGLMQKNTSAPIHFINDECLWVPLPVGYHTVPFIEHRDDELLFHQVSASTQIVADLLSPQKPSCELLLAMPRAKTPTSLGTSKTMLPLPSKGHLPIVVAVNKKQRQRMPS